MWGSSEEPPGTMEAGPPETAANFKDTYEQRKNQLDSIKNIMMKSKQNLKKKEEEMQEYANKLSKIKTRTKRSHHKEDASSSESTPKSKSDTSTVEPSDDVDDISQAKTPQEKSSLLQKKLAEDRKIFEQRSKELTESKRAVEEKVEALRQQLEEKYVAPVSVVTPVLVSQAQPFVDISSLQDKDNKIAELSNKIIELEALIIDLQDNLKEKDSVIESKVKAVTLISADLSEKGKTTLDTLEDTKDEMRLMQENFVLVESSLKDKNDNLLKQLEEKANQVSVLEENVQRLEELLKAQKQSEIVAADLSRSTMDTLTDTKSEMKSMQENFVLIETSLKAKNDHLLKQLEEREMKLAEAEARILNFESGLGLERHPNVEDLLYKMEKLEEINRKLEDEKYELQKSVAEFQDKVISSESNNAELDEKDNKIVELENRIEELKKSNEQIESDFISELQKQINELNAKNEEITNKVSELVKQIEELEIEKSDLTKKLSESTKDEDTVQKLNQELDELNKSMIKLKTQHKNKLKNLQKQLENFKQVSDVNAELVKLGNQVALLEEEKGNLQLSQVDFDELKASATEWKNRIDELEGKLNSQAKEIETHIEAIAILENQKLDLMQELHTTKQEVSDLEAENAESENMRVSAEMKVVELEEQLEKLQSSEIQRLTQENERLHQKLNELTSATKNSSEVGSTESFVKTGSNVDSTESFEALAADTERADLLKKIDSLTRENEALIERLTKYDEKAVSDSGSTESFEKLPDNSIENLTRENQELIIKLTKLEEKIASQYNGSEGNKIQLLSEENERLIAQIVQLQAEAEVLSRDKGSIDEESTSTVEPTTTESTNNINDELTAKIDSLTSQIEELNTNLNKLEEEKQELASRLEEEIKVQQEKAKAIAEAERTTVESLESEIERCRNLISEQQSVLDDMKTKLSEKEAELESRSQNCELDSNTLRRELDESASVLAEWKFKCTELESKLAELERAKQYIDEGFQRLQMEHQNLIEESEQKDVLLTSLKDELNTTIISFEEKLREQSEIIASQGDLNNQLQKTIKEKDEELHQKYVQIQNDLIKMDELQDNMLKLEDQLRQKDATITSLTDEVETLRTNSSVIEEDLFNARYQLQELRDKLERSKNIDEYNQLMEKYNDKELQVEELENKLSQRSAEISALKAQIETLGAENEQLREMAIEEERKASDLLEANRIQEEELKNAERAKAEVENRLLDLQAVNEENLKHARNLTDELQQAYKSLELLKLKHTEDIGMYNQRLDQLLDELQEKSIAVEKCIAEDVKSNLEAKIIELEKAVAEGEEKAQAQIEKMKKYAAIAKKRSQQCEEIEAKFKELEEKSQFLIEAKNREIQDVLRTLQIKDVQIADLEEQLIYARKERDQALNDFLTTRSELNETQFRMNGMSAEIRHLNEAKDNARELGVRMGVMESEYVEQLTLINSLRTENGLLLSKQAQINERLENVEKESEERRALLEKLEKEKEIAESQPRQCDPCPHCATLEAKLQERNAEIENLDNELHNSIGNLVQMQESLRMSTIPDSNYTELLQSYNALTEANDDTRVKLELSLLENDKLNDEIDRLLDEKASFQEKINSMKNELAKQQESVKELENLQSQYADLLESYNKQKLDLEAAQIKLNELTLQSTGNVKESTDGWDDDVLVPSIHIETQASPTSFTLEEKKPAGVEDEIQPFDASVFGQFEPDKSANAQEQEIRRLIDVISDLNNKIEEARILAAENEAKLKSELEQTKGTVATLSATLSLANTNLETKNNELESLKAEFDRLTGVEFERDQFKIKFDELEEIERVVASLIGGDNRPTIDKLRDLGVKLSESTNELDMLKCENKQLALMQESHIRRVIELENELKSSGESAIIAELESRISKISQERDLLQLQFNDANRAYDDLKENTAGLSKLQSQLDAVVQERNQLIEEIKTLRSSSTVKNVPKEESTVVSMWDDDEVDPWGTDSSTTIPPISTDAPEEFSLEGALKKRVDELEERLQELSDENSKLEEESKTAQVKIVKYVKKLKEYKAQLDSLQRELKTQKSISSGFGGLDSAIEEELKNQVAVLEKALNEAKEELKKVAAEKANLANRVDVLTAATERFTEAKEKQDVEVHIWQKRYKELEMKLQQTEVSTSTESQKQPVQPSSETHSHEAQLKELKENVEALAAENDELQHLLEEHRIKRQEAEESASRLIELEATLTELKAANEKAKQDYDTLRRQYEQSLMDADDEVKIMRNSFEQLKSEMEQKDLDIETLKATVNAKIEEVAALKDKIEQLENEKKDSEHNVASLKQEIADKQTVIDELNSVIQQKEEMRNISSEIDDKNQEIETLKIALENVKSDLQNKEEQIENHIRTIETLQFALEEKEKDTEVKIIELELAVKEQERLATEAASDLHETLLEKEQLVSAVAELKTVLEEKEHTANTAIDGLKIALDEKERLSNAIAEKESNIERLRNEVEQIRISQKGIVSVEQEKTKKEEELPIFTFSSNDNKVEELEMLRAEIKAKNETIEHLQYSISESATTKMIQELQDTINMLYNEKSVLEEQLMIKNQEIHALRLQLEEINSEAPMQSPTEHYEETLYSLKKELHSRDQELNALNQLLHERESQLRSALTSDQNHVELQSQVARLRELEILIAEDKEVIERLNFEKSEIKKELEEVLKTKEEEIHQLKERISYQEQDIANLKLQLEQSPNYSQHLAYLQSEVAEKDRRLAELSITKDTELHYTRLQLAEKTARLEELMALSEEEVKQLEELRNVVAVKEQQISGLMQQLEEKSKQYELAQHALERHVGDIDTKLQQSQDNEAQPGAPRQANELDAALYMLYQRDVRCEELTQELMQLLEERDTLQLRLSDALRESEYLKKHTATSSSPKTESETQQQAVIEDLSTSVKSEASPEIEEKMTSLALKLSQLKSVDQNRDIRLTDDRMVRHNEQMTLYVHQGDLSKLPPEAAARMANISQSRNVQSQSSGLMNWLWGKR